MSIIRKHQNGSVFSSKKYELNNLSFEIQTQVIENDPRMVYSEFFRSEENIGIYNVSLRMACDENEFFEEFDFLINELKGKSLDTQAIWDSFTAICGNHINQYGRLIDTDLESYLDRILQLTQSISIASGMKPISDEEGYAMRAHFRKSSFQVFGNYIFVGRRKSHDPIGGYDLIKLNDLLN